MLKRNRLYLKNNRNVSKTINIEDKLYLKILEISKKVYDAKTSDLINVAVEEYIERNTPSYYGNVNKDTVIYRTIRIRKENVEGLNEFKKRTGISFTRLLNSAISEFVNSIDI